MTKKDVTNIMYDTLVDANFIEDSIHGESQFLIFKSQDIDDYMVCKFEGEDNGNISEVFHTINECYDWINQNL